MVDRISFFPDVLSLAIAEKLVVEQGITLEHIAAEAFAAWCDGTRQVMQLDLDEPTPRT